MLSYIARTTLIRSFSAGNPVKSLKKPREGKWFIAKEVRGIADVRWSLIPRLYWYHLCYTFLYFLVLLLMMFLHPNFWLHYLTKENRKKEPQLDLVLQHLAWAHSWPMSPWSPLIAIGWTSWGVNCGSLPFTPSPPFSLAFCVNSVICHRTLLFCSLAPVQPCDQSLNTLAFSC